MAFYSMSQFRERVGISREALRFYESRGLITPQRKEGSNYRVYSDMDGLGVLRIKIMQSFRLSLDQIRERSKEISLAEQDAYLTQVEMHMEEQLRHAQNELARIRKNHSFVRDAMGAQGEVCELDTYGIYKLMLLGEGVQRDIHMEKTVSQWLSHMPMCDVGWHISRERLEAAGDEPVPTQIGLMMLPRYVDEYNVSIAPPVFFFPPGHSIRMMLGLENPFAITRAQAQPLFDYARQHGYRMVSEISGRYSGYACENGVPRYYFSMRVHVQ